MRVFSVKGGVRLPGRKQRSQHQAITSLPTPERLFIPLKQHIGSPAEPVVRVGEQVSKGQLIARAQGPMSAPLHAPTSGKVLAIGDLQAPHPSGLDMATITLAADGEERWAEVIPPIDPLSLDADALAERIAAAGIVGMGGATFPAAVKLRLRARHSIRVLIINGAECEPYLTCDDRLMQERADAIVDGVRVMLRALEPPGGDQQIGAYIAIERNKQAALMAMTAAASPYPELATVGVPTRYPMGSEKHLVRALSGREVPARALAAEIGVLVHNVGTAYAVHRALRFGRPLISRVVTVSGEAVQNPQNLEVLIGTPVSALLRACGGLLPGPMRLVMGGPMMGGMLPHEEVPVVKGTTGILALSAQEATPSSPMPCVRCGTCVTVCPCGLMPVEMVARIRAGQLEAALRVTVHGLYSGLAARVLAERCRNRSPC